MPVEIRIGIRYVNVNDYLSEKDESMVIRTAETVADANFMIGKILGSFSRWEKELDQQRAEAE